MSALIYLIIYILPIVVAVAFGYYSCKNKSEELLTPKLIGIYFLGTLVFWYGNFPIPIGLGAGYLIIRYWPLLKGIEISKDDREVGETGTKTYAKTISQLVNFDGKVRTLIVGVIVGVFSHLFL